MKFVLLSLLALSACQPQSTTPDIAPEVQEPIAEVPQEPITEGDKPMPNAAIDNTKSLVVVKVIYTESNGSLPPRSQYKNSFELNAENTPDFKELLDDALDGTQVNKAATLREYMAMSLTGDFEGFAKIRALSDKDVHPKGGQSQGVKFVTADGGEFTISNLSVRLSGTGLGALKQAARETGKATDLTRP